MNPLWAAAYVRLAFNLQVDGSFQLAWNILTGGLALLPDSPDLLEARGVISLQVAIVLKANLC